MKSSRNDPEIIVVALDLNRRHDKFDEYEGLSAREKLKIIISAIQEIYQPLAGKHPKSQIVIAWREYGINEGHNKRAVDHDFKQLFINNLNELTRQYPNLTIVAGTICTWKRVSPARLKKVKDYYEVHRELIDFEAHLEKDSTRDESKQFTLHEKEVDSVIASLQDAVDTDTECIVIRNMSYIFSHGHSDVLRHSKITPADEIINNMHLTLNHAVFQPAKVKGSSSLFGVMNSDNKQLFSMAVEICREHDLSVSKREISRYNKSRTNLHLVLSDSVSLQPINLIGDYTIHIDSINKPRLIVNPDTQHIEQSVALYFYNLLDDKPQLIGPTQELQLFEHVIVRELDQLISQIKNDDKIFTLESIKKQFKQYANGITSREMYTFLVNTLKNVHVKNSLLRVPQNKSGLKRFFAKMSNDDHHDNSKISAWMERTLNLVNDEMSKGIELKDYMSRDDPKPKNRK